MLLPLIVKAGEFPLGVYCIHEAKDVKTIKKVGFDTIQSYNTNPQELEKIAKEAQKQGVKVLFYPNKITGEWIEKAKQWPAIAWYIYDEPGVHHKTHEFLKDLDVSAREKFPQATTTFVVGKAANLKPYTDIADIIMVDWYPVPHLALTSLGEQIWEAKYYLAKAGFPNKPVWAVVQSFDWRNFKQHRPDNQRIGRFPTVKEMRFMAYHAITQGAEGIFFFHYQNPKKSKTHKSNWKLLSKVSKELSKMQPVFAQDTEIQIPFDISYALKVKAWLYNGKYYYLIVNTADKPVLLPDELQAKKYKSLFGKKAKTAEPYGVYIYTKKI